MGKDAALGCPPPSILWFQPPPSAGTAPEASRRPGGLFWVGVLLLFGIGSFPIDQNAAWVQYAVSHAPPWMTTVRQAVAQQGLDSVVHGYVADFVTPARGLLYLGAVLLLGIPLYRPVRVFLVQNSFLIVLRQSTWCMAALMALITNTACINVGGEFAQMSYQPFASTDGETYRRLLVPALAYFLQFQGPYLYWFFCYVLTSLNVYLIITWLRRLGADWNTFQWIAVLTSGFIIYQFELPGYVESGVLMLLLLTVLVPMTPTARAGAVALMLGVHEDAALFMALPFILLAYPKRERTLLLSLVALYFAGWLAHFSFDLPQALQGNLQVNGQSSMDWLRQYPVRALWGTFFAYKLLWLPWLAAVVIALRSRNARFAAILGALVLWPLVQVALGTDTSRLVGFGSLGVLAGLLAFSRAAPPWLFNGLLALNFLIPSVYAPTNADLIAPNIGLYAIWYRLLHGGHLMP